MLCFIAAALLGALQDDLDARLEALAGKLARDPASAKLAELCAGEFGRAALRERIDELVEWRTAPIDRDPVGAFERHYFAPTPTGALALRPERKADFDRLARDVAAAPALLAAYQSRAFRFAARIQGEGELEKRARSWWADSTFRVAFFHARAEELAEREVPELLEERLAAAFRKGPEGALRIDDARRDEVRGLLQGFQGALERIRELQGAYLKQLAGLPDDARVVLVTEAASVYVLSRLLRESGEELPDRIGTVEETENPLAFAVPLPDLIAPFREAEGVAAALAPRLDALSAALAEGDEDEKAVSAFFKDPHGRRVLVEHLVGRRRAQARRADAVFRELLEDGYEGEGRGLRVKRGRYREGDKDDAPEALDREHRALVENFLGSRRAFDLLAEVCADGAVARVLSSHEGTLALHESVGRLQEAFRRPIVEQGLALFEELYLAKNGDLVEVRPERAAKVYALADRAEKLRRTAAGNP